MRTAANIWAGLAKAAFDDMWKAINCDYEANGVAARST